MDDSERFRREQELIFQEMEEKALLQKQAIANERLRELLRKMKVAPVAPSVIFEMIETGKTFEEIRDFLDAAIFEEMVKTFMSSDQRISEEDARGRICLMMTASTDQQNSK